MSHSWERVPELPYFMKIPCIAYPLFKTLSNPLLYHPQTLSLLLFLMFCFFGWISDRATFDVILHNDIMDLYISSLGILESEGSCYVFYATRCPGYWGLTYNVFFCWYFDLISHTHTYTHTHTHTHTHKYTQQTQGPIDWHTHINISYQHLSCSHSSYLYYIEWIIHWYQKFTFHKFFSFWRLLSCESHIISVN